jgi:Tn3 transposase DDE domain-containing protein
MCCWPALEHDTPSVLFRQALEFLRTERIVRPGVDRLARAVATARAAADTKIYARLAPLLDSARREQLDALLVTDPQRRVAPLVWLSAGATAATGDTVKAEAAKLGYLRGLGADRLELSAVPPERRRQLAAIARQLNRGETLNELRRFIVYAHRGQILHRRHEDQTMQAHCHTLVVNACILSTTWYLHDAVDADRAAGHEIGDATIAHLTPARFEAINPYGLLTFEVAKILNRTNRRPLRTL